MIRALAALLALALLAGCASLNKSQCERGDWYAVGVRDGSNGRLPTYFEQHVKACSKYGITPQPEPWKKGREEGLKLYCTPSNAYQIGRRGAYPSPVCTPAQAADMAWPNKVARKYYEIGQEIDRLESRIREIDASLADLGDTNPDLTRHLISDRVLLRFKIMQLQTRQTRYASWP